MSCTSVKGWPEGKKLDLDAKGEAALVELTTKLAPETTLQLAALMKRNTETMCAAKTPIRWRRPTARAA